ncbi:hypothetical protein Hanom_Chr04g00312001 [Helianthus anomalus]
MPSSYPRRHMSLSRLEPNTSEKRWVSVANWATPVYSIWSSFLSLLKQSLSLLFAFMQTSVPENYMTPQLPNTMLTKWNR